MELDKIYEYMEQQRFDFAESALKKLLGEKITKEAQALLVSLYVELADRTKAEEALSLLLQIAPNDAYTLFLQARVHFMGGYSLLVMQELQQALQGGGLNDAVKEKIYNLLGQCYRYFGDSRKSTECYFQAFKRADTKDLAALEYSNYLFNRHYLLESEGAESLIISSQYNNLFRDIPQFIHRRREYSSKKIRIGYISPDFRNHVVFRFSYVLLQCYDHDVFEVYCYSRGDEDQFSVVAAKLVDGWRNLTACSAAEAARCIYEDQIDILFDLSGHTQNSCLPILAYRPAPVQISGIGYFATTGLSAVNYFLGDHYLDRGENIQDVEIITLSSFCEKIVLLPHSHLCYCPLYHMDSSKGAPCTRNGYITYGSFNNFTKVTDKMLQIWHMIIKRVKGARLLLKAEIFNTEDGRRIVCERLLQAGFDLQHVELRASSREYLSEYYDVDIALDTYPYPGGGTTCDALYMGVPVISLKGDSHGRRFGYSILMNADLEEFVADNCQEYIDKAVQLAGDIDLLDQLHKNLRSMVMQSKLMDSVAYMADVEAAYQKIWKIYCAEQTIPVYRQLGCYLPRLSALAEQCDWKQAMALADFMVAAEPQEPYILEKITEIYLDGGDYRAAKKILGVLKGHTKDGYDCFFEAEMLAVEGECEKSIALCKQLLHQGRLAPFRQGIVYNLLARLYKQTGEMKQSADAYRRSSECKLSGREKWTEYSNYLLGLHYFPSDVNEQIEAAKGYENLLSEITPISIADMQKRAKHTKMRIGYISGDFCQHVAAFFSMAFFKYYDPKVFDVYGYSLSARNEVSARMAALASAWREMEGLDFTEVAKQIAADEIDILVDLSGHTGTGCLPVFAYRPAPVQLSGIGYFGTTGLHTIDYFLVDRYTVMDCDSAIVDGQPFGFVEKLLRLPQSHLCYCPRGDVPRPVSAPYHRNGWVTFGCFNNFAKITNEMLEVWSCILEKVPTARLLLKAKFLDSSTNRAHVWKRLNAVGIDEGRVQLEGYSETYFLCYNRVDIALDTYPYPGGGTTCDALYMGVPVISLVGKTHHERFGYSILKNIGMEELAAFSRGEYIDKAVRLANNSMYLSYLHQTLRRKVQESPLMDGAGYMFALEQLYLQCWRQWRWKNCLEEYKDWVEQEMYGIKQSFATKQWDKVSTSSIRLLGSGIDTRWAWSALAIAAYYQHEYEKSALAAYKALSIDREKNGMSKTDLYFVLGQSLRLLSRATEAQQAFVRGWQCFQRGEKSVDGDMECKLLTAIALGNFRMGTPSAAEDYFAAYKAATDLKTRCEMYSSWLFTFHHGNIDAEELFNNHLAYRNLFRGIQPYTNHAHKGEKLRIGYVSADFREHVMYNFLFWLLAGYNHEKYEVYCYNMAEPAQADSYTVVLRSMVDGWRDLAGQAYASAAKIIHEDQMDILFDLAGHSSGSGLPIFAWKPAPIQISGLGYMDTTGLDTIDYFLADAYTVPVGSEYERFFTEKIMRLSSQFCYFATELPASSGAPCQRHGSILFGVFNHYRKITDEMLYGWLEILRQVPNSKLLLKSQIFVNLSVQDEAYKRMSAIGFDMDRVCFEPATRDYMYRYLDVDIALDTYPYPGGGTTCDALYMGVPVITRYGQRHGSRFGYSILKNIGLDEFAVSDLTTYIERAVALAKDTELLGLLHKNLRQIMKQSPLMDGEGYMKALESLYETIWHRYEK